MRRLAGRENLSLNFDYSAFTTQFNRQQIKITRGIKLYFCYQNQIQNVVIKTWSKEAIIVLKKVDFHFAKGSLDLHLGVS